jgi:hypothetical protein
MGHIPLCLSQQLAQPTNPRTAERGQKMIKPEQLEKIKKILSELKETEKCCGACGQFYDSQQADGEGFHRAIFCDAAEQLDIVSEKLTNLINNTLSYLRSESSKTYDDESYKNRLRGEVTGYQTALDLIKAAK